MPQENKTDYTQLTRLDYMIIQLVYLKDYEFLEDVLEIHAICGYGDVPHEVSTNVADILQARFEELNSK